MSITAQRRAIDHLARVLGEAARDSQRPLVVTDLIGVMAPQTSDPSKARIDAGVDQAFSALGRGADLFVLTGSGSALTAALLSRSGLRVPAFCAYGAQRLEWDGDEPLPSFHPRTPEVSPILQEVKQLMETKLRRHFGFSPTAPVCFHDDEQAQLLGGVLLEDQGNVLKFHPRTIDRFPSLPAVLHQVMLEAVQEHKSITRNPQARLALHIHSNNGNEELVYELGVNKLTVIEALAAQTRARTVVFNCADSHDLEGLNALDALKASGVRTCAVAIWNKPDLTAGRSGTPREVLERADLIVHSSAALGRLYGRAMAQVNALDPEAQARTSPTGAPASPAPSAGLAR